MGKIPAIQFYPGDWLRDSVSGCSLAAQGLWLRMMIVMHDCPKYGYLSNNGAPMPDEVVARRCGCTVEQYATLLDELLHAGVPRMTSEGILYSKRMISDEKRREQSRISQRKRREKEAVNSLSTKCQVASSSSSSSSSSKTKKYLSSFESEFWPSYPRKVARPAALKAWLKLKPSEVVIKAILGDLPRWRDREKQFIPFPATYLNQRRWEDEDKERDRYGFLQEGETEDGQ